MRDFETIQIHRLMIGLRLAFIQNGTEGRTLNQEVVGFTSRTFRTIPTCVLTQKAWILSMPFQMVGIFVLIMGIPVVALYGKWVK
jgi:uncharacterized membrane protein